MSVVSNSPVHVPASTEPVVAICGMALRLPGGVRDADAFWNTLVTREDLRGPVPPNRYNAAGHNGKRGKRSAINAEFGYFLDEELGALDTSFFSMSRKEVERSDPQQRMLLEIAREALESAGEADFRGKDIACYVGTFGEDWLQLEAREQQHNGGYLLLGHGDYMLANRVSYEYDLKGPSMVIKTGCSASLIALHKAFRAVQHGDCTGAIACGVNLIIAPTNSTAMTEEGVLAPDGACKSFDASADGYGRGEAVNAVYIKRLDDAIRDGNPIRAVIRNSGTNSDGRSQNIMMPNGDAHEALMRKVYNDAGLDPCKTAFVECHGTGTPTGDPLEVNAVGNVFGAEGVYIGSVKPNVGHSEGASGITSVIKGVLALENNTIPPNMRFSKPNPKIALKENKLTVPVKPEAWPAGRDKRVSVNSFGIGGSNAHVILESPPEFVAPRRTVAASSEIPSAEPRLLVVSANTANSLQRRIGDIQGYLERFPSAVDDLAYTLAHHRQNMPHRAFLLATADGRVVETSAAGKVLGPDPAVIMIFSGQGAQWAEMGKELLQTDEHFQRDLADMNQVLKGLPHPPDWNIQDELLAPAESSRLQTAELSQPLCTALQVALVNRLRRVGVTPAAVVGHSSGEIAAAYAAGMLSAERAIMIAYYRGFVAKSGTREGGMAAVGLGVADVTAFLGDEGAAGAVTIACDNSPSSTTLSGEVDALERVLARIRENNNDTMARRLNVDMAYHSKHMAALADRYQQLLEASWVSRTDDEGVGLAPSPPGPGRIPLFSSVSDKRIITGEELGPAYWVANLVSRVRFTEAVGRAIEAQGPNVSKNSVFLEVGPHATLRGPLRQICGESGANCNYVSTLVRGRDACHTALSALGGLYQYGVAVGWRSGALYSGVPSSGRALGNLPNYPWDHSSGSFWYEARVSKESRLRPFSHHRLLGLLVPESSALEPLWRNQLNLVDEPWLADHKVRSDVVFPLAGYVAMAGEAVRQITGLHTGYRIRNTSVHSAMLLSEEPIEIVTSLRPVKLAKLAEPVWFEFCIMSHSDSSWTKHCEGQVRAYSPTSLAPLPVPTAEDMTRAVSPSRWYQALDKIGICYGPEFQAMSDVISSTTDNVAQAAFKLNSSQQEDSAFPIHPVAIDACFQLLMVAMVKGVARNFERLCVTTHIKDLIVAPKGETAMGATAWSIADDKASVEVTCGTGSDKTVAIRLDGLTLTPVGESEAQPGEQEPHAAARLEWLPDFEMVDHSTLFVPPTTIPEETKLQEEMTLLCMIETLERIRGLEPCNWHFDKFRDWLVVETQRAHERTYPLLGEDATAYLTLSSDTRRSMIEEKHQRLLKMAKGAESIGVKRIYDNCEDIFTGKKDTLDTLMQGNVLAEIYNATSFDKGDFFKLLSHSRPNLRILEVGSGTGGTTESILRSLLRPAGGLPAYSVYTFSDISAGFFPQAQERFAYAPNMEYRVFDISQDPFNQGFEPETYDVIVASNVIHATASIRESLSHLHPLLRPGGLLVFTELCGSVRTDNYIFGNFSGWWLGEADGRALEPYVSVDRWDAELKAVGFSGVDTAVRDAPEPYHCYAAIVSTKVVSGRVDPPAPQKLSVLTDRPDAPLARGVVAAFEARGVETAVYRVGDASLPDDAHLVSLLDLETPFFRDLTPERLAGFQQVLKRYDSGNVLWVTKPAQLNCRDPQAAQALGVARSIRAESHVPFYTLEIDPSESELANLVSKVLFKICRQEYVETLAPDREYVVDKGTVKIGRYQPFLVKKELREACAFEGQAHKTVTKLKMSAPGPLDKLSWVTSSAAAEPVPGDEDVVIDTRAVGLNVEDVLYATGGLKPSTGKHGTISFGLEVAGVVSWVGSKAKDFGLGPGDKVVALPPKAGLKTSVVVPAALVQKVPAGMSFEQAATLPIAFATATEALIRQGHLEKGQSVLIHSATGHIGHAAVRICRNVGAEVFATANSEAKVDYLVNTMAIPKDHVFLVGDDSFVADLKRATHGHGVDLVLNPVSNELFHAAWDCLAEFGNIVCLARSDAAEGVRLTMNNFERNRSYCSVDFAHLIQKRPQRAGALLAECIKLCASGTLAPLHPTVFEAAAVQDAFRWVQDESNIGKAVVRIPADVATGGLAADADEDERLPYSLDRGASYLITGGLGGLGTGIATWMVERGARSLVFLSRSAGQKLQDRTLIRELQTMGCEVVCVPGRAESAADVQKAISLAPHPIKGVVHLAMVVKKATVADMTYEEWLAPNVPKVEGAWNLHEALDASGAPALDFFVLASSSATVVEQPGLGNYSAANTFLEAFTQYRRARGLPASVLNICPIEDVGYMAENARARRDAQAQGLYFLGERELLDFLELCMKLSPAATTTGAPAAAAHPRGRRFTEGWTSTAQLVMGLRSEGDLADADTRTNWRCDRRMGFYHNLRADSGASTGGGRSASSEALAKFLAQAGARPALLVEAASADLLAREIGTKVLGLMLKDDDGDVDTALTLQQLGLDSLMAIELRRWWKAAFGLDISVLEIMARGSLRALGEAAAAGLKAKLEQQ